MQLILVDVHLKMEEKLNKNTIRRFVLVTKVLPMIIAAIHLLNTIISFFHGNDIPLNYIGGISLLPIGYLYLASYTFGLCEYYRMYLHYCVITNIVNIYDSYIGIPVSDYTYFILFVIFTIVMMFITIYMKFFKK